MLKMFANILGTLRVFSCSKLVKGFDA